MNDDARATNKAGLDPFSAEILRNYLLVPPVIDSAANL